MKSVLITGVNGLLGQNLLAALKGGYEVSGLDVMEKPVISEGMTAYFRADITDPVGLKALFTRFQFDIIINTAAITNVDLCEKERDVADKINHQALSFLMDAAPKAKMVQISSDYVFDGEKGPYSDSDAPNPVSFYGETKFRSEKAALARSPANLVVRTMVLFGHAKNVRPDFITFVRDSLSAGKQINIVTDQVGNITLASNLAHNIRACIEAGLSGVLALSGLDILSRHEIALCVARHYGLDGSLVRPILTSDLKQAAKRPLNSGFRLDRARTAAGVELLDFNEQLRRYDRE